MQRILLSFSLLATSMVIASEEASEIAAVKPQSCKVQKEQPPRPFFFSEDESEFFAFADFIYWDAVTTDPMNYALKQFTSNSNVSNATYSLNKDKSLNYGFHPGFRVGTGYRFGRDKVQQNIRPWQIEAEYTHLHTRTAQMTSAFGVDKSNPDASLQEELAIQVPSLNNTQTLSAHSRSKLNYDRIDLKFAWPMWITPSVLMRLMLGGTAAWFDNNWKTRFFDKSNNDLLQKSKFKWNYWGGGIFGGSDIYMGVGSGFGFFADASFALLFGPMEQKQKLTAKNVNFDITQIVKFHFNEFQPVVNVGLGVDYKHWFNEKIMLRLALGWDFTWWFDLNQFGRIAFPSGGKPVGNITTLFSNQPSDLGYHGLTARVGFEF